VSVRTTSIALLCCQPAAVILKAPSPIRWFSKLGWIVPLEVNASVGSGRNAV